MVKKEDITFDSRDGKSKIHALRWVPEGKIICIVQIVHGMAEYIERYEALAQYLGEKGILVTGDDHLGHGKSVGKEGTYGYFCDQDPATVVVRDVHRLKRSHRKNIRAYLMCCLATVWDLLYYAIIFLSMAREYREPLSVEPDHSLGYW